MLASLAYLLPCVCLQPTCRSWPLLDLATTCPPAFAPAAQCDCLMYNGRACNIETRYGPLAIAAIAATRQAVSWHGHHVPLSAWNWPPSSPGKLLLGRRRAGTHEIYKSAKQPRSSACLSHKATATQSRRQQIQGQQNTMTSAAAIVLALVCLLPLIGAIFDWDTVINQNSLQSGDVRPSGMQRSLHAVTSGSLSFKCCDTRLSHSGRHICRSLWMAWQHCACCLLQSPVVRC